MSGGIYHPPGCRCPGCLPAQYVMRPSAPARASRRPAARQRPASPAPVYRHPPRSHAYNCRCNRCVPFKGKGSGDVGILLPLAIIGGIGFLTLCWPALVWHGYTDTGGWRWDIHSTIACLAYWGFLILFGLLIWLGNTAPAKTARRRRPPRGRLKVEAGPALPPDVPSGPIPDTPICTHRNAIKVENILNPDGPAWAYLCMECGGPEGTQLPAEFGTLRRECCGTIPGTPHWGTCPELRSAREGMLRAVDELRDKKQP